MQNPKILWADDEIDLLKPHVIFLESKGYDVTTVTSGDEAIDEVEDNHFDIVFLDENMPGLNGLETLRLIKTKKPNLPVIMITKSEEESIMEDAIGAKIADYLIKPVNPKQILLVLKKHLNSKQLVKETTTSNYQREFRNISMRLMDKLDIDDWYQLYDDLVYWELELEKGDESMKEILVSQKAEANQLFSKFIKNNYSSWLGNNEAPVLSHNVFSKLIEPNISKESPTLLLMIDNLRWDQWKIIKPFIQEYYRVEDEKMYTSILPTATQYARNAFFSGLMPSEIKRKFPENWKSESDEGSKNQFEKLFLENLFKRKGLDLKTKYFKINNLSAGKKLVENFSQIEQTDFTAVVYNFVDMLSHARTEMEVIRELADNEKAYRSLTKSWFENSPLFELIKKAHQANFQLMITTDHGTIRVTDYTKIIGYKNTNANLRYKVGKNLSFDEKEVYALNPEDGVLPSVGGGSKYVFAIEDRFFVYPNNLNYYKDYYMRTFQHGGISLEEMLIPFVSLKPKK